MKSNRIGKLSKVAIVTLCSVLFLTSCGLGKKNSKDKNDTISSTSEKQTIQTSSINKKKQKNKDVVLQSDEIVPVYKVTNEGTAYEDVRLEVGIASQSRVHEIFTPAWNFTEINKYISKGFLDGATLYNEDGSINENDGPIEYKFDEKNKSLTMTINEKFTWSNGDKFVAEDIIGTYLITARKNFKIRDIHKDYANIIGLEAYAYGYEDSIAGIEKISDSEVKISFGKWDPMLRFGSGIMTEFVPGQYLDMHEEKTIDASLYKFTQGPYLKTEPISYGPYVLDLSKRKSKLDKEYIFVANKYYWQGDVAVKEARLQVIPPNKAEDHLAKGKFDIFYIPSEYYGEAHVLNNGTTLLRPASSVSYMSFRVGTLLERKEKNAYLDKLLEDDYAKIAKLADELKEARKKYLDELRDKEKSLEKDKKQVKNTSATTTETTSVEVTSEVSTTTETTTAETTAKQVEEGNNETESSIEETSENTETTETTVELSDGDKADLHIQTLDSYKELKKLRLKVDITKDKNYFKDSETGIIDPVLREAIYKAIDSNAINVGAFHGLETKAKNIIPPALNEFYDDLIDPYDYEPNISSDLLDEAGYKDIDDDGFRETPEGEKIKLEIFVQSRSQVDKDIENYFLKQMNLFGLDAKVSILTVDEYNKLLLKNSTSTDIDEAKKIKIFVGYLDFNTNPDLRPIFDSQSKDNFIYLDSEENKKFSDSIYKAMDNESKKDTFSAWSKNLMENYFFVPMRNSYELVFVNNRVSSFDISDGVHTPYWKINLISFEPFKADRKMQ